MNARFRQLLILLIFLSTTIFGVEIMDPADVRIGMHGEGTTILSGEEKITFGVEILGVVNAIAPDYPMIIARLDHPLLKESGIVAGMSGSPVMIDGKLLGAVAYGWSFSKEPICGITPATVMHQDHAALPLGTLDAEALLAGFASRDYAAILPLMQKALARPAASNGMTPLPLPLSGGEGPLNTLFKAAGLLPSGGGHVAAVGEERRLKAGDPIAAALALGPYSLYASGTVTEVEGEKVYVFGHPFLGSGGCDYPMARAHPVTTIPSLYRSFRLANMGALLGRFTYDGRSGLLGVEGEEPDMISFSTTTAGKTQKWRLIRHPLFSPLLMAWALSQSMANHPGRTGRGTWMMDASFTTTDGTKLHLADAFAGEGEMKDILGALTAVPLLLAQNPYRHVTIGNGSVTLQWEEKPKWERVTALSVEEGALRGGDEATLRIVLTDQEERESTHRIKVTLPPYPDGTSLRLYLVSGETYGAIRRRWIKASPRSYNGILRMIEDHVPANHLLLLILRSGEGLTVDDTYLPRAGGRLSRILHGRKVPWTLTRRDLFTLPVPIRGYVSTTLTLRDHGGLP